MPGFQIQLDTTAVGDFLAATNGVRVIREEPIHLLGGADIELIAAVAEAILIAAEPAGVDAEKDIVSIAVGLAEIMGVAGGD